MGLDYAYELVADRQSTERLLRAVCAHVAPADRARLSTSLGFGVPEVMDRVERDDFERQLFARGGKDICLTFLFPGDEHLAAFAKDSPRWPLRTEVEVPGHR